MQSAKAAFDQRRLAIAVISFAEPAKLLAYQQRHQWPFTLLADPKRITYQIFGLERLSWFRVFSPTTLRLYWNLLRKGMKAGPYAGDDIYQAGGDFLLDHEGKILFAHRSRDPADRPAVAILLQAIDSASRTP